MLRTILVSLIVILSGCASTQNEKLTSKRIGVLTPESHNNQFCYLYKGVTVFNNESAREELSPNFSNSFNASVGKGITKSGNIPVSLGKLPAHKISSYFERKEWDHSITLTKDGRKYIESLLESNQVDYILLPWLYDLERCMVSVEVGYSDLEYALDSNVQLHLLNAQTLQHIQSRHVSSVNSMRPIYLPKNKATPTITDKAKLSEKLYVELEDDVFRLLDGDCCYSKRNDLP
ncbi:MULTISPECIES: hypothetical protein [Pseudoalteromonas]|uniref:hypothetical protein n=1 Tax=Pseudoalteromonas TaxID=53246 RepID=UPI0011094D00|nr:MULTISPECIES: hypothetical protein [Pseudoalteromonas]MCG9758357.1 hypothetical protein [Pseudoalteromonas sp. Isolate6]NKC20202.1 hypothetical protein [Pseudoalteromonas galatheae]